jgi:putative folate metabolism gamma-glutamate ligase
MYIRAVKTERLDQPQDLCAFIDKFLPPLKERTIVAITSKVVSICEGRTVPKTSVSKEELVKQEADLIIPNPEATDDRIILTYKNHLLIPSAGIDESNGNGRYILYPKEPFQSVRKIWEHLRQKHALKEVGVLMTDSRTTPLRWGVTGVALAWQGFTSTASYIGKPDLFGQPLRVTKINVADALAVGAVFSMGESSECTPLALITEAPHVIFDDKNHNAEELCIDPKEDLYRPLLKQLISGEG